MRCNWSLILPSPAKINLGYYVLSKRDDNYHEVWTINQEVGFHDTLYFSTESNDLVITTNHPDLPVNKANLVYRAVKLLNEKTGCSSNVRIHIEKRIPIGGGLGGGSSNASTTLMGLNRLFQLGLTKTEFAALGASLGMDVPFFFFGGTSLATGRAEIIRPLPNAPIEWILLVNPGIHVSTEWAFKSIKLAHHPQEIVNMISRFQHMATMGDYYFIKELINMFETVTIKSHPIIRSIKQLLLDYGAKWSMMTGTGSTVYGVFDNQESAEIALRKIERPQWLTVLTHTVKK